MITNCKKLMREYQKNNVPSTPLGVDLLQALVFRMLRNENCNLLPSLKRDGFHF